METMKTILEITSIIFGFLISIGTAFVYLDQNSISIALMSHKEKIKYKYLSILVLWIMMFAVTWGSIAFICWSEFAGIIFFIIYFFYWVLNCAICLILYISRDKNKTSQARKEKQKSFKYVISIVFNDSIILLAFCLNIFTLIQTTKSLSEGLPIKDILVFLY